MSTIVSLLWGTACGITVELARTGWRSFAFVASPGTGVLEQLAALGADGRVLTADATRAAAYAEDAAARAAALSPAIEAAIGPLGERRGRSGAVAPAARERYRSGIEIALRLIDAFDEMHDAEGIAAILLSEAETVLGRVPARWARARGVPTFVVTHGSSLNRLYTCLQGWDADRVFVYGERGVAALLDDGVPRENVSVTGNPAWDSYTQLRANRAPARELVLAGGAFDPDLPIVLFATTWSAKLSAFGDPALPRRVAHAFFTACARLEAGGRRFSILVKGRPMDGMGEAELREIAASAGCHRFGHVTGPMDVPLAAADLAVGYDTGAFLEAMMLGVPCVNVWSGASWIFGPPFAADDGVPLVPWDDPERLAAVIDALLFDPETRARHIAEADRRSVRLSLPGGGAAARIAGHIASALPPPEPLWSTVEPSGRDAAVVGLPVHPALIARIPAGARDILAFDAGGASLGAALTARFPGATIRGCESNAFGARAARRTMTSVIEATPEALRWSELGGASLDAVVLPGTLHRCINPHVFLETVRAHAPGATVVAGVDNLRNLWLARDIIKGTVRYRHQGAMALDHLRWYSIAEAIALFRGAGYTVREIEAIPDARKASLGAPPADGTFDLTLPEMTVRGVSSAAFDEFTVESWVIVATPA